MLRNDKQDDLKCMYGLLARVPAGLQCMCDAMKGMLCVLLVRYINQQYRFSFMYLFDKVV